MISFIFISKNILNYLQKNIELFTFFENNVMLDFYFDVIHKDFIIMIVKVNNSNCNKIFGQTKNPSEIKQHPTGHNQREGNESQTFIYSMEWGGVTSTPCPNQIQGQLPDDARTPNSFVYSFPWSPTCIYELVITNKIFITTSSFLLRRGSCGPMLKDDACDEKIQTPHCVIVFQVPWLLAGSENLFLCFPGHLVFWNNMIVWQETDSSKALPSISLANEEAICIDGWNR